MNGNLALVVDQAGATLDKGTHDTLVLTHADGRRERLGLRTLGSVVLHGDVKLSTGLLQAMAAHGVAFTTLPLRGQAPAVGFARLPHRQIALRHGQHLAYADPQQRLQLARLAVWAKLDGMIEFARRHAPDTEPEFWQAMRTAGAAEDLDRLMGVEGAATARHFQTLEALYQARGPFRFNGRSRRPPRDAVNAMMSLTYTLAQSQATQLALRAGLDVHLGFLHAIHRDRESLALDLIEAARPELDRWVHDLLTRQALLAPEMFTDSDAEGTRLSQEGRARFYPAWFREGHRLAQVPMRRLLARLLEALRAAGRDSDPTDTLAEAA